MNKNNKQSGSANLVIVIMVVVAIVGALVYACYQKFSSNSREENKATSNSIDSSSKEGSYKTYTTDKYNVSFQYPSDWSVSGGRVGDDSQYQYDASVKNSAGNTVAQFQINIPGGGVCDTPSQYFTIESEPTSLSILAYRDSVRINTTATFSFNVIKDSDGTYGAHFGLTDLNGGLVCENAFNYYIATNIDGLDLLGFANNIIETKKFSSIDDARKYAKSDEYAKIKKMIMSLKY
jgi:hypothetical protein